MSFSPSRKGVPAWRFPTCARSTRGVRDRALREHRNHLVYLLSLELARVFSPGMAPVLVSLRPSSEVTDDPSKLARFSFLEGHPCWSKCGRRTRPFGGRAFREHRTNVGVLPPLLLNRGELPLPFLDSHEGPGFAGFGRYLFAAFDEIARFSALLRQRQIVVTGTPAKPCGHVLPRLFGPDFQDFSTEEHHIVHMVPDVLTGIVG